MKATTITTALLIGAASSACGDESGPSEPRPCEEVACSSTQPWLAMKSHEVEQYRLSLDAWATRLGDACGDVARALGRTTSTEVGEGVGRADTLCSEAAAALAEAGIVLEEPEAYGSPSLYLPPDRVAECIAACPCEECRVTESTCDLGRCSGTCARACVSLDAPVTCEGRCVGRCEGICSSVAMADGSCPDTCSGACLGTCELPESGAACDGLCLGGCDQPLTGCAVEGRTDANPSLGCPACREICREVARMDLRIAGVVVLRVEGLDAATMAALDRLMVARGEWTLWSSEPSGPRSVLEAFPETPTYGGSDRRCLEDARPAAEALAADLDRFAATMARF